jgi:UDP-glucuronate decarboxylase
MIAPRGEQGMNILITGGAGFIGTNLAQRLLDDGNRVHVIDDLSTGSIQNCKLLAKNPGFSWHMGDICDEAAIRQNYRPWHQIYNLACRASPVAYQADPLGTMRVCVDGLANVLALARSSGAKVLQASTSEVYGDPTVHPQREDYWGNVNPMGPRACYDEGKRFGETICFEARKRQPVSVARIFNTYGPFMAQNDGRVVSNFIVQALRGEPLTVYGDGSQTRSFCYVADTVDGLIRLMDSDEMGPVNLGNPIEYSVLDLAHEVLARTGSKSKLVIKPLPTDDPTRRRPDIGLASARLGWHPRVGIHKGLDATISYFKGAEIGSVH